MPQDLEAAVERLAQYISTLTRRPAILIVEDNEDDLRHIERQFHEAALHVDTDATQIGAVALSCLEEFKFDLILLDLRMQPIDGMDIIRGMPDLNKDTPIVTISGHDNGPLVNEALELGVWLHLRKPVTAEHLKQMLNRVKL